MRTITGLDELKSAEGEELGTTDWHEVTQEDIDAFADVTGDHQWIHVDPERAQGDAVRRHDRPRLLHAVAGAALHRADLHARGLRLRASTTASTRSASRRPLPVGAQRAHAAPKLASVERRSPAARRSRSS